MRFSEEGTTPTTFTGSSSDAIARIAPSTAAPADMSNFISSIPLAGLMLIPPASKVSPFPTRTSGDESSPAPRCSTRIRRGSCSEPCATARSACIFSSRIRSGPKTVTERELAEPRREATSARCDGVATLPGRAWRVRARFWPSAIASPTRAPRSAASTSPSSVTTVSAVTFGGRSSLVPEPSSLRSSSKRHAASFAPSTSAWAALSESSPVPPTKIESRSSSIPSAARTACPAYRRTRSASRPSRAPIPRKRRRAGPTTPPR